MGMPELHRLVTEKDEARGGDLDLLIAEMESLGTKMAGHSCPRFLEQLRAVQFKRPRWLICSLLDGDVDLPLAAVLGANDPERIVRAVMWLGEQMGVRRRWVILDAGLRNEWTRGIARTAAEAKIRCIFVRNDYPQSDPTLLLYTLLGKRMPPGELPTEHGVMLLDGAAAWRLAIADGLASTPLAVRDLVGNSSRYAIVPVGWTLERVLGELKISYADRLIRVCDPLRDIRVQPGWLIDGSEVTVHLMRPERVINPDPCVRCGWCAEGCPVRIQPAGLLEAAQRSDPAMAKRFGLHACIECGICAYVCPSRLPLLEGIRSVRALNAER